MPQGSLQIIVDENAPAEASLTLHVPGSIDLIT